MDDNVLYHCNEGELLALARAQGVGLLRRGLPRDTLVEIVAGMRDPTPEQLSGTTETRRRLEKFIFDNIERTRSQLPGCTGQCTKYPCSEGRHAMCFGGNADVVR